MTTETKQKATHNPILDPNDTFIQGVMRQKHIDHEASHSNLINQFLHLISSSIFLYCYAIFFNDYSKAVYMGLASLVIRQAGHYIFEPPCHDKEQAMLGFDTEKKVQVVIVYGLVPALILAQAYAFSGANLTVAQVWLMTTFCVVFGRVFWLWSQYGFKVSMHWYVKFVTDPFTDLPAYWRSMYQIFNPVLLRGALHMSFPNTFSLPHGYVSPKTGYDKEKSH